MGLLVVAHLGDWHCDAIGDELATWDDSNHCSVVEHVAIGLVSEGKPPKYRRTDLVDIEDLGFALERDGGGRDLYERKERHSLWQRHRHRNVGVGCDVAHLPTCFGGGDIKRPTSDGVADACCPRMAVTVREPQDAKKRAVQSLPHLLGGNGHGLTPLDWVQLES